MLLSAIASFSLVSKGSFSLPQIQLFCLAFKDSIQPLLMLKRCLDFSCYIAARLFEDILVVLGVAVYQEDIGKSIHTVQHL